MAWDQKRAAINEKYQDLRQVPFLVPGETSIGREAWRFPTDWYELYRDDFSPKQMAKIKRRAKKRQAEYMR